MSEFREPSLEVVIGFKGVGKTYLTNQIIDQYVKNDPSGWKARPALVFDVNNEFCDSNGYYGYKTIDFNVEEKNDFKRASEIRKINVPGKYRIWPIKKNGQPMGVRELELTARTIVQYYRNGLLLLEDMNKYALSNFRVDFVGMFVGLRHLGVDLVIHFQSLRAIPPKIWSEMTILRWHKQSEKIFKYKNRISNLELYSIAESIVDRKFETDPRYHLWIKTMEEKLVNVTPEDFRQGCLDYLSKNRQEVRRVMNEISLEDSGKRKFSNENEAIKAYIERKSHQYLIQ